MTASLAPNRHPTRRHERRSARAARSKRVTLRTHRKGKS